jgi:hypothetical protein
VDQLRARSRHQHGRLASSQMKDRLDRMSTEKSLIHLSTLRIEPIEVPIDARNPYRDWSTAWNIYVDDQFLARVHPFESDWSGLQVASTDEFFDWDDIGSIRQAGKYIVWLFEFPILKTTPYIRWPL